METNKKDHEEKQEDDKHLFIIHFVENYPCLYNKHLNDYKNNVKKIKAWTELTKLYQEHFKENDVRGKLFESK